MLVKFRLTMMVVISSQLAYAVAAYGGIDMTVFIFLSIGGFFVTCAANTLNQVLERDYDAFMERTKDRPLAAKRMKVSDAVMFAGILSLIGVSALAFINPLTGLLGTLSMIIYAFIYTPLKRVSTVSVGIGAIPGALPVLIGCTAYSGTITLLGLLLFCIQFLWQFPHFWAIGYLAFDDYQKAGYKLLPESNGQIDRKVGLHSFIYALLLIVCVFLLVNVPEISAAGILVCAVLSAIYSGYSLNFYVKHDRISARKLMFSSFFYLPLVLIALLVM